MPRLDYIVRERAFRMLPEKGRNGANLSTLEMLGNMWKYHEYLLKNGIIIPKPDKELDRIRDEEGIKPYHKRVTKLYNAWRLYGIEQMWAARTNEPLPEGYKGQLPLFEL